MVLPNIEPTHYDPDYLGKTTTFPSFLSSPTLFLGHQFIIPIKDDLEDQRRLPFLSSTTLFFGTSIHHPNQG